MRNTSVGILISKFYDYWEVSRTWLQRLRGLLFVKIVRDESRPSFSIRTVLIRNHTHHRLH